MKLHLSIEGMHCEACTQAVTASIVGLPGIESADVQVGSADVVFDSNVSSKAELVSAIHQAGSFQVTAFASVPL